MTLPSELFSTCKTSGNGAQVYSREALLSLRWCGDAAGLSRSLTGSLPEGMKMRCLQRPRKRGRRGGVRQRLRKRGSRPPLPSMILSNVRSLRNKMDTLRTLTRGCFEYRESCIMLFTETWLHPEIPDGLVEIEGHFIYPDNLVTFSFALFTYPPTAMLHGLRNRWQTVFMNNYRVPQMPLFSLWEILTTVT